MLSGASKNTKKVALGPCKIRGFSQQTSVLARFGCVFWPKNEAKSSENAVPSNKNTYFTSDSGVPGPFFALSGPPGAHDPRHLGALGNSQGGPQDEPKRPQGPPRRPPGVPKTPQDAPKRPPRGHQKTQEAPKRRPQTPRLQAYGTTSLLAFGGRRQEGVAPWIIIMEPFWAL